MDANFKLKSPCLPVVLTPSQLMLLHMYEKNNGQGISVNLSPTELALRN